MLLYPWVRHMVGWLAPLTPGWLDSGSNHRQGWMFRPSFGALFRGNNGRLLDSYSQMVIPGQDEQNKFRSVAGKYFNTWAPNQNVTKIATPANSKTKILKLSYQG